MRKWYVIYCKPRQDARAASHLTNQGYEVFHPLTRVRKVVGSQARYFISSLFPRYLFIHLDDRTQSWAPIRSTRGVTGLVQAERHKAAEVPEALIEGLRARVNEEGWIESVSADRLAKGDRVVLLDGAFEGCEAIFEARTAAERVVVLLTLLGGHHAPAVPESFVVKAQ